MALDKRWVMELYAQASTDLEDAWETLTELHSLLDGEPEHELELQQVEDDFRAVWEVLLRVRRRWQQQQRGALAPRR